MKKDRHEEILRLIQEHEIDTQEELVKRLNEGGFSVTQATISRDIRDLELVKIAGTGGRVRYAPLQKQESADKFVRVLRDAYVSGSAAENLLVLKTASGMAMAAAAALDALGWPEIVGTIAGDDTIFCATHKKTEATRALEKLEKLVGE